MVEATLLSATAAAAAAEMRTVFWFRKGLRLHDNPALVAALDGCTTLYPVFCLDPWFVSSGKVGANRMRFLLEVCMYSLHAPHAQLCSPHLLVCAPQSLRDLDSSLRDLNSRLIVLQGNPKDELPRIFQDWDVQRLAYEVDIEPYAKTRDAEINGLAAAAGVEVLTRCGHTLCDPEALLRRAGGTPTTTYSTFLSHFEKVRRSLVLWAFFAFAPGLSPPLTARRLPLLCSLGDKGDADCRPAAPHHAASGGRRRGGGGKRRQRARAARARRRVRRRGGGEQPRAVQGWRERRAGADARSPAGEPRTSLAATASTAIACTLSTTSTASTAASTTAPNCSFCCVIRRSGRRGWQPSRSRRPPPPR